jgi:hypothetical protein
MPICKWANYDSLGALFGGLLDSRMPRPSCCTTVSRGFFESISSAPKLSRLGTFGAGGLSSNLAF